MSADRSRVPVLSQAMQRHRTDVSPRDADRRKDLCSEWHCCSSVDLPETVSLRVPRNGKPHSVDAGSSENRSRRDAAAIGYVRRLRLKLPLSTTQLSK